MKKDFVELSKKWFDKQAPIYDKTNTRLYSKHGKISCNDIYNYLKGKQYESLLDVGCGSGWLIDILSTNYKAIYIGLDLSPKMIKIAKEKNIKNAEFIEGRADDIPFKDNTFDVVTCSQSFHHYPDTDRAMKEAYRVLKPGGIYIISDTGVGPFGIIGVKVDDFIYRHFAKTGDCNVSYMKKTVKDMKRNKFKVIDSRKVSTFIYTVVGKK